MLFKHVYKHMLINIQCNQRISVKPWYYKLFSLPLTETINMSLMLRLLLHHIFIHRSLLMSWAYKDGETDRNQSKREISNSTKSYLWSQSSLSSRSVYLHSIIQWNCKRNSMVEYKEVMNLMASWDFAVADTISFTTNKMSSWKT